MNVPDVGGTSKPVEACCRSASRRPAAGAIRGIRRGRKAGRNDEGSDMAWQQLIAIDRCQEGAGTFVAHNGLELAVFVLVDPPRVIVTDNACPHASGNLSGGTIEGETVACPWHHWTFDLNTGVCTHSDLARVRRYPAETRDGHVWFDSDASA